MKQRIGVRGSGLKGEAAPCIPELDGSPARIGAAQKKCALCGASGHAGSDHGLTGKAVLDRATGPTDTEAKPSGSAMEQDRKTQNGWLDDTKQSSGSAAYESPGSEGGMS